MAYDPIPDVWTAIPGWFDFEPIYDGFCNRAQDGEVLVEIGSFLGRSACYLGTLIKKSGKKVTLLCVDPWPSTYRHPDGHEVEAPFETFYANVRQSGLSKIIVPIRTESVSAASFIRNDLRCVFIDGDHRYSNVIEDIKAWLPKVIKGGLLAGHDYNDAFPDVIRAVNEVFRPDQRRIRGNCWLHDVK